MLWVMISNTNELIFSVDHKRARLVPMKLVVCLHSLRRVKDGDAQSQLYHSKEINTSGGSLQQMMGECIAMLLFQPGLASIGLVRFVHCGNTLDIIHVMLSPRLSHFSFAMLKSWACPRDKMGPMDLRAGQHLTLSLCLGNTHRTDNMVYHNTCKFFFLLIDYLFNL